jgi:sulfide:quinone oxidoreductase
MQLKQLEPGLFVSPQISAEDIPAIVAQGIKAIIGNRPDGEGGNDQPTIESVKAAAEAAGLTFTAIPFTAGRQTLDDVDAFTRALQQLPGPVLAYCRTGSRSSQIWAMARAGTMPVADILAQASAAGMDLSKLAPVLEQLSLRAGTNGPADG